MLSLQIPASFLFNLNKDLCFNSHKSFGDYDTFLSTFLTSTSLVLSAPEKDIHHFSQCLGATGGRETETVIKHKQNNYNKH